ncbi:Uncharacterized protein TCM_034606 [Theobroma cacao]|uniref:Uncharacterized protein n=1 Tax=Theobroma cacao TaxID=3641 RepID=A0A061FFB0_THECC|nr:Uncharacterized protein TCM_034606 [Theobroma cacao]
MRLNSFGLDPFGFYCQDVSCLSFELDLRFGLFRTDYSWVTMKKIPLIGSAKPQLSSTLANNQYGFEWLILHY